MIKRNATKQQLFRIPDSIKHKPWQKLKPINAGKTIGKQIVEANFK
jgi:hypothetical protein